MITQTDKGVQQSGRNDLPEAPESIPTGGLQKSSGSGHPATIAVTIASVFRTRKHLTARSSLVLRDFPSATTIPPLRRLRTNRPPSVTGGFIAPQLLTSRPYPSTNIHGRTWRLPVPRDRTQPDRDAAPPRELASEDSSGDCMAERCNRPSAPLRPPKSAPGNLIGRGVAGSTARWFRRRTAFSLICCKSLIRFTFAFVANVPSFR